MGPDCTETGVGGCTFDAICEHVEQLSLSLSRFLWQCRETPIARLRSDFERGLALLTLLSPVLKRQCACVWWFDFACLNLPTVDRCGFPIEGACFPRNLGASTARLGSDFKHGFAL